MSSSAVAPRAILRLAIVLQVFAGAGTARAGGDLVAFPERFAEGVLYATVQRGNITEHIYTSRTAIDAVKNRLAIPGGTVITMADYRDGKLFRYVVMEKRAGWGAGYPAEKRNGEWEFQAFNADKTVNRGENLDRCFACHKGQEQHDFVFTLDRMKAAP